MFNSYTWFFLEFLYLFSIPTLPMLAKTKQKKFQTFILNIQVHRLISNLLNTIYSTLLCSVWICFVNRGSLVHSWQFSYYPSITWNDSQSQSINQLINQSINESINQSINQLINQLINQSTNLAINHAIMQSCNHSIIQSIHECNLGMSINADLGCLTPALWPIHTHTCHTR